MDIPMRYTNFDGIFFIHLLGLGLSSVPFVSKLLTPAVNKLIFFKLVPNNSRECFSASGF